MFVDHILRACLTLWKLKLIMQAAALLLLFSTLSSQQTEFTIKVNQHLDPEDFCLLPQKEQKLGEMLSGSVNSGTTRMCFLFLDASTFCYNEP